MTTSRHPERGEGSASRRHPECGEGSASEKQALRFAQGDGISRRAFTALAAGAAGAAARLVLPGLPLTVPLPPRPSAAQLAWQREELSMFVHFGVNTFTDREWGDGTEPPAIFNPQSLDARQWARTARAAGFRAMILTAKHHDGFCLWPTSTTRHSVASSPFRNGAGDVVREFVTAARAEQLRVGLYLSPWDRNARAYGEGAAYNDFYVEQLAELLTRYGAITEVWFDGANGEGPSGRKQSYDWPRIWGLVRKLQPSAVIFSDAGPDVRWIGNETGSAGDPNWSTVDPAVVTVPGQWNADVERELQHGNPAGTVWRPGETDTSIRPGWFHHPAEDDKVKSVDRLVDTYFTSVGRNSKLLLNVPPTRDGLIHAADAGRLAEFAARRAALFGELLVQRESASWRVTGARTATLEVPLIRTAPVSVLALEEPIEHGQAVARFTVWAEGTNGTWSVLARGETVGHRRLVRCESGPVRRLRVTVDDALRPPRPLRVSAWP